MSDDCFEPISRVLPRQFEIPPALAVPLSQEELQELGSFVAIWSQIDFLAASIIAHLTKTNMPACVLFLESSTTGPRINILKKAAMRPPDTSLKKQIASLCNANNGLIEDRNHIMHGLWAINWNFHNDKSSAACLFQKGLRRPLFAAKLKILTDRAAKLSNDLGKALRELGRVGDKLPPPPMPYFFGEGDPPPGKHTPPWPPELP
jgi:hypothetical protein